MSQGQTVLGVVADSIGAASSSERFLDRSAGVLDFQRRERYWACPSTKFRPVQAACLPVTYYGAQCGVVRHLELRADRRLWAVAEVDGQLELRRNGPWQFSYQLLESRDGWFDLAALAIVPVSESICIPSLLVRAGPIAIAGFREPGSGIVYELLHHAEEAGYEHRGSTLAIHGTKPAVTATPAIATTPLGPIEFRSAQPVDVEGRNVTVLAAPYNTPAAVVIKGRLVAESFANTAFVGRQPKRIYSTRDHDVHRVIGRVTSLDPADPAGLHAVIQVANTELGRESLELAKDGVLGASVAFQCQDEAWATDRTSRRVTKALLREIALTPEPAYETTAVLDVRTA